MSSHSETTWSAEPVTPLTGTEVTGVDLGRPLPGELVTGIRGLLAERKVLFFRGQHLDPAQALAFARQLGPVLRFKSVRAEHPDYPGVHVVEPAGDERRPDGGRVTGFWHIDATSLTTPPFASVLRAVTVPPAGGDTIWANLAAAYDGLAADLKDAIGGLAVTHHVPGQPGPSGTGGPLVSWPLVRVHPDTKEKVLYVNFMLQPRVAGWDRADSDALMRVLKEEATRPEYEVRFRWSPGAVAVWDNRATHHYGVADYGDFPRRMERILVADPAATASVELI
ncbi:MAG: TauD/TfdA family dioxygenase [Nocardiopsaceae bacterium]|nr:TauD/TfdA family dioxygenase [Nocardiopsaceae bacterium]